MPAPNKTSHPLVSNNFPEYDFLSSKSKRLLNGIRGAFGGSVVSAGAVAVGTNPNLLKHTPEIAEGGMVGLIGSVAVLGVLAHQYINSSDRDERAHTQQIFDQEQI